MPVLTLRFLVAALLIAWSVLPVRAVGQSCPPYVPHPGSQSLDIWLSKPSNNNCAVTDGSYVLKGSVLRLDALGTAYGYCERWWPLPTCHVIATYQRNMQSIDAWNDKPGTQYWYYSAAYGKNQSGECRVGVAHEIDTRNYSPTSCGRFGLYTAQYDGQHTITAEGDIQPTPCSISPVNTEQETISFNARCALSRGTPCNGTLLGGGGPAQVDGLGYKHYHGTEPQGDPYDIWGSCNWVHNLISIIGAAYDLLREGEVFGYGDISRQGGGPFPPHGCHENGLEVDVWYPNINGTWQQTDLSIPSQLANYDRERMLDLMNVFATAVGPESQHMVEQFILSEKLEPVPPPGTPNPAAIAPADLIRNVPIIYDHDDPNTPDNEDDHRHHFHVTLVDEDGPDAACY